MDEVFDFGFWFALHPYSSSFEESVQNAVACFGFKFALAIWLCYGISPRLNEIWEWRVVLYDTIHLFMAVVGSVMVSASLHLTRKSIRLAMRKIQFADLHWKKMLSNANKNSNFTPFFYLAFFIFDVTLNIYAYFEFFSSPAPFVAFSICFCHVCYAMFEVTMSLNLVADRIRNLDESEPSKCLVEFACLNEGIENLSCHFGPTIVISTVLTFSFVTFNGYKIYGYKPWSIIIPALDSIETLVLALNYIWMISSCSKLYKQVETFNKKLYDFCLIDDKSRHLQNPLVQLHLNYNKDPRQISACRFFTADFPVVQMILGAASSYLVLLFQIDQDFE